MLRHRFVIILTVFLLSWLMFVTVVPVYVKEPDAEYNSASAHQFVIGPNINYDTFLWEDYDDTFPVKEDLAWFRVQLDPLVWNLTTDLEKAIVVRKWVAENILVGLGYRYITNGRQILEDMWQGNKTYDCFGAAAISITAYQSVGLQSRLIGIEAHVLNDVWINELNKWIVMDAIFNVRYLVDGFPASAVEIHEVLWKYAKNWNGITVNVNEEADFSEVYDHTEVVQDNGRFPNGVDPNTNPYLQPDGKMSLVRFFCVLDIVARNDFLHQGGPSRDRGELYYYGYLYQLEDRGRTIKDPCKITKDAKDFEWNIHQVLIHVTSPLIDTIPSTTLRFETNTPNFQRFYVSSPDGEWEGVSGDTTTIDWSLGENIVFVKASTLTGGESRVASFKYYVNCLGIYEILGVTWTFTITSIIMAILCAFYIIRYKKMV